eukprot:5915844-Amphidinium_carterae.1
MRTHVPESRKSVQYLESFSQWSSAGCLALDTSFLQLSCTITSTGSVQMQRCFRCCWCLTVPDKAPRWGKRAKSGAAKGNQCFECQMISRSYPSLTWEALVAKALTSSEMAAEITGARKLLQTNSSLSVPTTFSSQSGITFKLKRNLKWMSVADFTAKYGNSLNAEELGFEAVTLQNERGVKEAGFVFEGDNPTVKDLEISWLDSTQLCQSLLTPSQ